MFVAAPGFDTPPQPGQALVVAPGILWVRMPLPLRLNHVNLWILEEEDGWTAVDCGANTLATRELWTKLLDGPLAGRRLRRLVATHGHLDHVGSAGWLVGRCEAEFLGTLSEWQGAQLRYLQRDLAPAGMDRFFWQHGCDEETIARFLEQRTLTLGLLGEQPASLRRIRDGDEVRFSGRVWLAIVAGGHADEHVSFYCSQDRILIAGDQVLPRITPVIGVFPSEPEADPLSDYLLSLEVFERLPADCLVLPSHGSPFKGLHARLAGLRRHHSDRLAAVLDLVKEPASAWEAAAGLFPRAVAEGHGRLALSETLAHLHRLRTLGTVGDFRSAEGSETRFVRSRSD